MVPKLKFASVVAELCIPGISTAVASFWEPYSTPAVAALLTAMVKAAARPISTIPTASKHSTGKTKANSIRLCPSSHDLRRRTTAQRTGLLILLSNGTLATVIAPTWIARNLVRCNPDVSDK
jgi:hypothetical protein